MKSVHKKVYLLINVYIFLKLSTYNPAFMFSSEYDIYT